MQADRDHDDFSHDHSHPVPNRSTGALGHAHGPVDYGRAFAIGVSFNLAYVVVQVVYGILANSVALLADAAHNLSDVLGLVLAWGASVLVRRLPSQRFTYGLRKSSVLAALVNGGLLLLVTGGIAWEALHRFVQPVAVQSLTVVWVAAVGILINGGTALLFVSGRKQDLNIRGAFLHMAVDAVVSLGVVVAGLGIIYTGWLWLDPAVSLVISAVIVAGTWGLLRDSLRMSLDAVPEDIDMSKVRTYLAALAGVAEVHDLHVWSISTTETALTVHLVMPAGYPGDTFVAQVCNDLHARFGISHATTQVETDPSHPCTLAPDNVV